MNNIENSERRAWLKNAMAACGLAALPTSVWSAATMLKTEQLSPFLVAICDCVIPDTSVPGAVKANVPAFIQMAVQHGLEGANQSLVTEFEQLLNDHIDGDFATLKPAEQEQKLAALDEAAFSHPRGKPTPPIYAAWKTMKSLVLLGYFTSEIGASEALRYVLVPGEFKPDVPLSENPKAFSTDWTGVKYG